MSRLDELQVGDTVTRMLGGTIPMQLKVTALSDTIIRCGDWTFCRKTGAEIDEELQWGPRFGKTGSFLIGKTPTNAEPTD